VSNNLKIPASNKKQAMKIDGSQIVTNRSGTAPGVYFNLNGKAHVLLPGPPSENQPMIKGYLTAKLAEDNFIDGTIQTEIFRIYNTGESAIADLFAPVKSECDIGYYFSQEGWIEIHVSRYAKDPGTAETKVGSAVNVLKNLLDRNGFFYTDNRDLGRILLDLLKAKGLTLSFAESITGGGLSGEFIKNSGASDVITGSIVAYSNEVKRNVLGVKKETLAKFGAVSEECAAEMVTGLKKIMKTDVSAAVSGIAGPAGGSGQKPVGTVCFGFNIKDKIFTAKNNFIGNRTRVIKHSINRTFIELIKMIKE
jgi:nicotinamide-nucleotide amidase